jgi:hypothetical protein
VFEKRSMQFMEVIAFRFFYIENTNDAYSISYFIKKAITAIMPGSTGSTGGSCPQCHGRGAASG